MDAQTTPETQSPPAPAGPVGAPKLQGRPPLVITFGFSGHRDYGDEKTVAAQMDTTLMTIQAALALLLKTPLKGAGEALAGAYGDTRQLRLLTGDAPGADGLMIQRWTDGKVGPIHRLYPYKDPITGDALTDRPERASDETRRTPPSDAPWTGLDAVSLGLAKDQAHAEVTQWIIRHSEALIAFWDGEQMTKPGGTGDTLRKALERGLPVIWLQPGETQIRLADPALSHRRGGVPDTAEDLASISSELTAEDLASMLGRVAAPPGAIRKSGVDPEVIGRQDYAKVDPLRRWRWPFRAVQMFSDRTLWKAFKYFEFLVGGKDARRPTGSSLKAPDDLAAQPGFVSIRAALSEATTRAGQLSSIHRSQQLLLIALAAVAVFFGALPALTAGASSSNATNAAPAAAAPVAPAPTASAAPTPHATHAPVQGIGPAIRAVRAASNGAGGAAAGAAGAAVERDQATAADRAHAHAAEIELSLVASALVIAALAGRYHRHRRWSDARRLAERLRAARATWPLGVDITDGRLTPSRTWTEWRAEAVLRAAGPRQGWIDGPTFQRSAAWVIADLLDGQTAYHERQFLLAQRIGRTISRVEQLAFFGLMLTLCGFIIGYWLAPAMGWRLGEISGWVTLASAVCPAIGAACIALEATSGFGELEMRSERLQNEFRGFKEELGEGEGLAYHHVQDVIRRGAQLLVEESGVWRDQVARRRLIR